MRLSWSNAAFLLAFSTFASAPAGAADLVTHLFPLKDGEAPNTGGNHGAVMRLDAGSRIGWIAFQTGGADLSLTSGSKLTLFVDSVYSAGRLKVYALTASVDPEEMLVQGTDLAFDDMAPIDSADVDSSSQGKIVRLNLGSLLSSGTFYGLAVVASNSLQADIGSKDSDLQPLIELKYAFATPSQVADAITAGSDAAASASAAATSASSASSAASDAAGYASAASTSASGAAGSASAAATSATAASGSATSAATSATAASGSATSAGTSATAASGSAASASSSATSASSSASSASSSATSAFSSASSASSSASAASSSASAASSSATAAAASADQAAFAGQIVLSTVQTPPSGYSQTGILKPFETAWVSKASGTSRYDVGTTTYNGKMYIGGGYNGSSYLTTFQSYDPSTNSWTSLAGLPATEHEPAMAETGGKIYSMGGIQSSVVVSANYQYDPSTNSWTTKTSLPKALCIPAAVSYGGKIHLFGGSTNVSGTGAVADHYSYDPTSNTWDTLAAMSEAKEEVMAVVSGTKIHIFGGYKADGTTSNVHQIYDPSTNTWSSAAACPSGMRYGGAMAKDGVIYIITSLGGPVYEYDTAQDIWIKLADNITPRYGMGYGLFGNTIYLSQGYGGGILSSTEAYTLPTNIWYMKRN